MKGQAKLLELFFLIGLFLYIFVNAKIPKVKQEIFVDVPNFLEFEKIKEYALQFDINSVVNVVDDIIYPEYTITDIKIEVFEPFSIIAETNISNHTICFAYNFPNSLNLNSIIVYHKDEILKTQVIFEWYQVEININTSVVGSEKTVELSLNLTFPEAITCSSISLFYEDKEIPIYLESCESFFINGTINITFKHIFEQENETFYLLASRNNLIKGLRASELSPDISVEYNYTQPEKSNRATICFKIPENITDFNNFILYYNYRKESYPQYQLLNKSYESIYEEFRIPIIIDNSENNEDLRDYQVEIKNPYFNEKGLVVHMPFNEGSGEIAKDLSGFGNDMNFVNHSLWTDGKFSNASYFNGSNYGIIYRDSILNNMSVLTLSFWFKTNETQNYKFIVEKEGISGYCWGGYLTNDSNKISFYVKDSNGNVYHIDYNGNFADDKWHFFAGTFDGRHISLYIDGELVNQSDLGKYVDICNEQGDIYVGAWYSNNKFFIGAVDELRIYNRVLSSEEINKLYLAKIRPDYENVGFFYINGTSIPFWMEKSGVFWLKVPYIKAKDQTEILLIQKNTTVNKTDPNSIFEYYDSIENFSGWQNWQSGSVDQVNRTNGFVFHERYSLRKYNACHPSGGYKDMNITLDRNNWIIEFFRYRKEGDGTNCYVDRTGIGNASGYGYNVAFDHSTSQCWIDKMSGTATEELNKTDSTINPLDQWYIAQLILTPSKVIIRILDLDKNLICESSYADTTYSSFTHIFIEGGRPYYVDYIRIRKYTDPEPSVIIGNPEIYEIPMYNSTDLLLEGYEVKIRNLAPNRGTISKQLGGFGICKREAFYENTTIIFEICLGKR